MTNAIEFDQSGVFAQLFSSLDEIFGLRDRDHVVGRSVDYDLSCSSGEEFDGAPSVVSVWILVRRSAHEPCNDPVSQPLLKGSPKVANARKRNCTAETVLLSPV
jgi:hypothetical protein